MAPEPSPPITATSPRLLDRCPLQSNECDTPSEFGVGVARQRAAVHSASLCLIGVFSVHRCQLLQESANLPLVDATGKYCVPSGPNTVLPCSSLDRQKETEQSAGGVGADLCAQAMVRPTAMGDVEVALRWAVGMFSVL